jgi:hypothetical protein
MKEARQPVSDDESRGEVQLCAEEEAMLNEAIAEADADPDEGMTWEEFRRQLRGQRTEAEAGLGA